MKTHARAKSDLFSAKPAENEACRIPIIPRSFRLDYAPLETAPGHDSPDSKTPKREEL